MLRATIFNVGQASSIMVDFGKGRLAIVDCGVGVSGRNPLAEEIRRRLDHDPSARLAFVLFTHLDWDHINGVVELARGTKDRIGKIYCNLEFRCLWDVVTTFARTYKRARFDRNPSAARNLTALGAINKMLEAPPAGVMDFHGELVAPESSNPNAYPVRLRVEGIDDDFSVWLFAPSQTLRDGAASALRRVLGGDLKQGELLESISKHRPDWNAASAVMAIEHRGRRILFGGDANFRTWSEILSRNGCEAVMSDVIVAWHHGARLGHHAGEDHDSKVWDFVLGDGSQKPAGVLVSHGAGRYGHPHGETIDAINRRGAAVACTQLREGLVTDLEEVNEAMVAAGFDRDVGAADEWSVYRSDGNACSGNIMVEIDDKGALTIKCDGPRQIGDAPRRWCCLYPAALP